MNGPVLDCRSVLHPAVHSAPLLSPVLLSVWTFYLLSLFTVSDCGLCVLASVCLSFHLPVCLRVRALCIAFVYGCGGGGGEGMDGGREGERERERERARERERERELLSVDMYVCVLVRVCTRVYVSMRMRVCLEKAV